MIFKNSLLQLLYDTLFSGICATLTVVIISLAGSEPFSLKVFISVFLGVFVPVWLVNAFIRKFIDTGPGDDAGEAKWTEPPVYMYDDYHYGYAMVRCIYYTNPDHTSSDITMSFVDLTGKLITDKWYVGATDFNEYGVAVVFDGSRYNLIDGNGNELSAEWFDAMKPFVGGIAKVYDKENDSVNYIDAKGNLLWKEWKHEL